MVFPTLIVSYRAFHCLECTLCSSYSSLLPSALVTADFITACSGLCLNGCEKPWPEPTWERKGLFGFEATVHYLGRPRQELKQKTDRRGYILPSFLWLARLLSLFSGPTCLGMAPPSGPSYNQMAAKKRLTDRKGWIQMGTNVGKTWGEQAEGK